VFDTVSDKYDFTYRLVIKNIGNKPVNLLFYDQTFSASADSLDNTLSWKVVATDKHEMTLRPGEIRNVYGKIRWSTQWPNQVPVLVKFGDANSIYYCTEEGVSEQQGNDADFL
jgi:archaellum component FlaG (FlaF/FlaG flagellin family)